MSREAPIIVGLFRRMNAEGIRYVQFKSTVSLERSFQGKTDFDLLVAKQDAHRFQRILLEYGAKQRHATFNVVYSGMEDYLLYDAEHEQMHHFHVHYDLIFGRRYRKNYRFPDLEKVFAEVEIHPEYNIPIVTPRFELFLLAMRAILKFDPARQTVRQLVRGYRLPAGMKAELHDLWTRVDLEKFQEWLSEAYPEPAHVALSFLETYQSNCSIGFLHMVRLSRGLERSLWQFERTDKRTARTFAGMRRNAKRHEVRWLPSGGRIISVIGADGAGKSTLVRDLVEWLSYKLSANTVYLGQSKQSFRVRVLNQLSGLARRFSLKHVEDSFCGRRALLNARVRLQKWQSARHDAGNGKIIITDRYPLREFHAMKFPMDGPRLKETDPLYDQERSIYEQIAPYPDILIALSVSRETAAIRTKPMNAEQANQHRDKVLAIEDLVRNGRVPNMFCIDANDEYSTVLRKAKEAIWNSL